MEIIQGQFQVLDADKCSSDMSGELKVSIADIDLTKSNEIWGDVIRVKRQNLDRPELLISLNFLPGAERLTVVIMKAKNLEFDDVFVKFYLIQNGKRIKKKKTNFSKADHIWNEAFTFNLPSSSFNNSGLEVIKLTFTKLRKILKKNLFSSTLWRTDLTSQMPSARAESA